MFAPGGKSEQHVRWGTESWAELSYICEQQDELCVGDGGRVD